MSDDNDFNYPGELPICEHREEILALLKKNDVVIVCGDTGSGKTTQLPKMAMELGRGKNGRRIACPQPRRLAAVTVAERVAEELKSPVGGIIGYQHRFARRVSEETRVKFMTDGVLLAETRSDPLLRAYDTIIVDEAHGAHFSMHPYFPESAVRQGADLVIQSTHKTLPALTQTALLHNATGLVPDERIRKFIDIYETSSPSYVLMASITKAIHRAAEGGGAAFEPYAERLKGLRHALAGLSNLRLFGGEDCVTTERDSAVSCVPGMPVDPGKIVIETDRSSISGPELYDRLRTGFHLQPEMKAPEYVILMTSVNDTQEGFDRLIAALREIDREVGPERPDGLHAAEAADRAAGGDALIIPERARTAADESTQAGTAASENRSVCAPAAMTIAEAADAEHEIVPLDQAAGRIAGDYIIVYPPDSPLVVPGERFTEENIRTIRDRIRAGLTVTGFRYGQMPEQDLVEVVAH